MHVKDILDRLKSDNSRWDAILDLKLLEGTDCVPDLILALTYDNWIIRWCVSEKLGDILDKRAIIPLISLLDDPDKHVRQNVLIALRKFGDEVLPLLVKNYASKNINVRKAINAFIKANGSSTVPVLVALIKGDDWVVDNHILFMIRILSPSDIESILLSLLNIKTVQKNTLIMLRDFKVESSLSSVITLYSDYSLRFILMHYLNAFDVKILSQKLITVYLNNQQNSNNAGLILIKLGSPVLIYLYKVMLRNLDYIPMILLLLEKIGPDSIMKYVHERAKKDLVFSKHTKELRMNYPYL